MGRKVTILHRLRDRDPADDGVCPIGGAWGRSLCTLTRWVGPGRLYAHVNPMGGGMGAVPRFPPRCVREHSRSLRALHHLPPGAIHISVV